MTVEIIRESHVRVSITLDTTLADTPAIDFQGVSGGIIIIPTGSTITGLKYHVSDSEDGTYVQLYDRTDNTEYDDTVAAARAYALPEDLFGAAWVKIEPDSDAQTVTLLLKG